MASEAGTYCPDFKITKMVAFMEGKSFSLLRTGTNIAGQRADGHRVRFLFNSERRYRGSPTSARIGVGNTASNSPRTIRNMATEGESYNEKRTSQKLHHLRKKSITWVEARPI